MPLGHRASAPPPHDAAWSIADGFRAGEFARLDRARQVYLDYTGSALYAESQVRRHAEFLLDAVLGNPHSENPSSRLSTELMDYARHRVLGFFNASPSKYCVIFTANASHALKLVGESYPFSPQTPFALTFDNHNSVNGIREFARAKGATVTYLPVTPPDLRVEASAFARGLARLPARARGLFAYPAQSNFSGVQHPLGWINTARDLGWDVLLDAAAFVPANRLDLSRWQPDFVVLSFYKIFGYPTGVGALIARRAVLPRLQRPWFAGGTITAASVGADRHVLMAGETAFEDGTPNFGSVAAIPIGLDFIEQVGIDAIHARASVLTACLLNRLCELRHSSGRRLVKILGPEDTENRGATVAFNFHDASGLFIDHQVVEARASERGISLRTGCFCNPGAGEVALGITAAEMGACFARTTPRMTYNDFRRCIDGKSSGAVRVSLGLANNLDDVEAFVEFARGFLS